jgi:hypothetical protein
MRGSTAGTMSAAALLVVSGTGRTQTYPARLHAEPLAELMMLGNVVSRAVSLFYDEAIHRAPIVRIKQE